MVIGFAGENDKLGGLPQSGGVKPENFLKLCKKSGVRWALAVRDPTHSWYHRGLRAGDTSGFNAVLELLQEEIELVQPREVMAPRSDRSRHACRAAPRRTLDRVAAAANGRYRCRCRRR